MSLLAKIRDTIAPSEHRPKPDRAKSKTPEPVTKDTKIMRRRTFHNYTPIVPTSDPGPEEPVEKPAMFRRLTVGFSEAPCPASIHLKESPENHSRSIVSPSPLYACLIAEKAAKSRPKAPSETTSAYPRPLVVASEILALRQSLPSHFQEIPPPPAPAVPVAKDFPPNSEAVPSQNASNNQSPHTPSPLSSPNRSCSSLRTSNDSIHYHPIPVHGVALPLASLSIITPPYSPMSAAKAAALSEQYTTIPPLRP
jgi:hypothetical protein